MKKGIVYNERFIEVGSSFYLGQTARFFRGGLKGLARTLKCDDSLAILVYEEDNKAIEPDA